MLASENACAWTRINNSVFRVHLKMRIVFGQYFMYHGAHMLKMVLTTNKLKLIRDDVIGFINSKQLERTEDSVGESSCLPKGL